MGKSGEGIYKPIDKITGVSWNFVRLVCGRHTDKRPGLILRTEPADRIIGVKRMIAHLHSRPQCTKDYLMKS